MSTRVSRRERLRRLYFLAAVEGVLNEQECPDIPASFNADATQYHRWATLEEPIPLWIVQLAKQLYHIPEPALPWSIFSLELIEYGVVLGVLLALAALLAALL